VQVFVNSYIEGSVDFIWGFSVAYFYHCKLVSNTPGACIAAQSRATTDTAGGYVFDSCLVTYSSTYGNSFGTTYLGRPYSQFSVAVYMNSYLDKHINPAGWSIWSTSNPQTSGVLFGEFNNSGPGSWESRTQRANFATKLTAEQVAKYKLGAWIGDTSWIDMNAYNAVPSYSLTGSSPSTPPPPSNTTLPNNETTPVSNTTPYTTGHPSGGIVPPEGAVIVSLNGANNAAFTTISAALASLPKDSTSQTIFVYPGSYNEQIAPINRPGAVRIIGCTTSNPGQSYKDNQVTITFSRGLSVSPLPAGHSNAETATFATASSSISLYNINMINTDNLDGTQASYVTLVASVYGDRIAFYGCSFDGWQDTLLTGSTAGYSYFESCYIGGATDFIWGYSKSYFKGCTIGAKRKGSAVTAHSRASMSAIGGYIFDQCLFTAAPGADPQLTGVFLGRPYSQYALVVVKNSYLDGIISPAGWKIWSATDPRTSAITFAEYNNSGPSSWEANVAARHGFGFATLLTSDSYSLSSVMASTDWIDMTYWNSVQTPMPAPVSIIPPTNVTVNGTSIFNGTTPPIGALIVSKTPIAGMTTYATIQGALDAAPTSSKTNATIFIFPGVYEEQLIVNKSGHTIFLGYSEATDDFGKNQVTIQSSRGIDTQGTSGSNTEGATVYVKGNFFHAYNINFKNNFGARQNMASLGFAVQSSKHAGLYGCQVYGNQDTLSVSGNLFTFKTYVEGNVDFIYGSGSAYFLDSTISPNADAISITAHKRTDNSTNAGFVFDQCTIKPVSGAGTFKNVGLGRPWNSFSRVAYVNCYLDSMITPAGWNSWSKSSPNIDGVQYGEYRNFGPGASICNRAKFSRQLSDVEVSQYQLTTFFGSIKFIDYARLDTQPFTVGNGQPQTCATVSSSISSITPSITLSSMVSSSSLSSLSIFTASTTVFITATPSPVISTTIIKLTETLIVSGSDIIKSSTIKGTATVTVTSPDVISTLTHFLTKDVGLTITSKPVTKTSVAKSTLILMSTTTEAPKTTTVKATTIVTVLSTSSPKAVTSTTSVGSTRTITSLITPKVTKTTVMITSTVEPISTKTSTIQPTSITVSTISTKTTTKKSTTTLSCIPTAALVRRGAVLPRAIASTTSVTITGYTTLPASTIFVTQSATAATKTTSIKGSTIIQIVTAILKTSTIQQAGATQLTIVTSTSQIGKTTTLKASTSTLTSTSLATQFSVLTLKAVMPL
jgi:pectin methylesterase-like acyl-CoA thioesterase